MSNRTKQNSDRYNTQQNGNDASDQNMNQVHGENVEHNQFGDGLEGNSRQPITDMEYEGDTLPDFETVGKWMRANAPSQR